MLLNTKKKKYYKIVFINYYILYLSIYNFIIIKYILDFYFLNQYIIKYINFISIY